LQCETGKKTRPVKKSKLNVSKMATQRRGPPVQRTKKIKMVRERKKAVRKRLKDQKRNFRLFWTGSRKGASGGSKRQKTGKEPNSKDPSTGHLE